MDDGQHAGSEDGSLIEYDLFNHHVRSISSQAFGFQFVIFWQSPVIFPPTVGGHLHSIKKRGYKLNNQQFLFIECETVCFT